MHMFYTGTLPAITGSDVVDNYGEMRGDTTYERATCG
jgi:hypothetical protein